MVGDKVLAPGDFVVIKTICSPKGNRMTYVNRGNRSGLAVLGLLFIGLALILIPAGIADARVKPKNGFYLQNGPPKHPNNAYIQVDKGKVVYASANLPFKTKSGKPCRPPGYNVDTLGFTSVFFDAKKKAKPNKKSKFKIANKKSISFPGLSASVKGKFKTRKKASFKVVLKVKNCTATRNFSKALYTPGG